MKRYSFLYSTDIQYDNAVTKHIVRLRCQPMECYFQHIKEELLVLQPGFWWQHSVGFEGCRILQGGMQEIHDTLAYSCAGVIEHSSAYVIPDNKPHGMYLQQSTLTRFCDGMQRLLTKMTGDFLTDCLAISHSVFLWMTYAAGTTTMQTSAADAFHSRQGVCQDYAHLMVCLCRAVGIPSRYVCGLMMGEGVTHAWVECHDGQCWYAFDPTNDTAIAHGFIKIAHGRDAQDCAVSRGTFTGLTTQITNIKVQVKEI